MPHVVTRANTPLTSASGRLRVHQVPAATDNLIWLIEHVPTQETAVVDGPSANEVLSYVQAHGLRLTTVINTHTHGDHIGVNHALQKAGLLDGMRVVGCRSRASEIPGLTDPVGDGDEVRFADVTGRAWLTEGHLNGHMSYVFEDLLFCGDTLFGAGCGYLFDGPPKAMHESLTRLAALPPETHVFCAHEYTMDNLRFAFSIDQDNDALIQRIKRDHDVRREGGSTIPSTIGMERATNPFLRQNEPAIRARVQQALQVSPGEDHEWFAAIRALKDRKDYKSIPDASLPLS